MNERWNLDPIYKGFDDPAYEKDLNTAKELMAQYTAFMADLSAKDPAEALHKGIERDKRGYRSE